MGLYLKVDVTAGTSIGDAARQMCDLARSLGLTIEAKFNDVLLMAFPDGDPKALAENWYAELTSKKSHKIATSVVRPSPSTKAETHE